MVFILLVLYFRSLLNQFVFCIPDCHFSGRALNNTSEHREESIHTSRSFTTFRMTIQAHSGIVLNLQSITPTQFYRQIFLSGIHLCNKPFLFLSYPTFQFLLTRYSIIDGIILLVIDKIVTFVFLRNPFISPVLCSTYLRYKSFVTPMYKTVRVQFDIKYTQYW